jgi:hypothetical protein
MRRFEENSDQETGYGMILCSALILSCILTFLTGFLLFILSFTGLITESPNLFVVFLAWFLLASLWGVLHSRFWT